MEWSERESESSNESGLNIQSRVAQGASTLHTIVALNDEYSSTFAISQQIMYPQRPDFHT